MGGAIYRPTPGLATPAARTAGHEPDRRAFPLLRAHPGRLGFRLHGPPRPPILRRFAGFFSPEAK